MRSGSCVFEGKAEACGFLSREKSGARYNRFSRQVSFSAHTLFQDSCVFGLEKRSGDVRRQVLL